MSKQFQLQSKNGGCKVIKRVLLWFVFKRVEFRVVFALSKHVFAQTSSKSQSNYDIFTRMCVCGFFSLSVCFVLTDLFMYLCIYLLFSD